MKLRPFLIETWFRKYDFNTEITLCSSGVAPYSLAELRALTGLSIEQLDEVVLQDSYSYGLPQLREKVAEKFGGASATSAQNILMTHGSSEALFLVQSALLQKGDEVIALTPAYQSHYSLAEDMGCLVKHWPLRAEEGFAPNLELLSKLLTPKTKAVIVNFPNNPTGASLSPSAFREMISIIAIHGAYLLWDDAFGELVYDEATPPLPDPASLYERVISFRTLSKAYGLPGLRIGWCQAPQEIIEACVGLRDYTTLNLSPLNEMIAWHALNSLEKLLAPKLTMAHTNRAILNQWVEEQHRRHRVSWHLPRGGVSGFLHLPGKNAELFCQQFAKEKGVFILPGNCFGFPDYVRVGFGHSTALLQEGLKRLGEFLNENTVLS